MVGANGRKIMKTSLALAHPLPGPCEKIPQSPCLLGT